MRVVFAKTALERVSCEGEGSSNRRSIYKHEREAVLEKFTLDICVTWEERKRKLK